MRVGVSFAVTEPHVGDHRSQRLHEIGGHIGICVFVDGDRTRGVRHDDVADAFARTQRFQCVIDLFRDEENLFAFGRADVEARFAHWTRS